VQFRWRMGSDTIIAASGWRVDSIKIATPSPPVVSVVSGDNQSVRVDDPYPAALTVQVLDNFDEAAAGKTVTFTAPSTGASVTFPSGKTAVTNASGVAGVAVVANGTAGAITVNATTTGGANTVPFTLTNLPNLPPENVSAGGPYVGVAGDTLVFSATATDPEGRALTYSWDVNGDDVFGDFLGQRLNLSSIQLTAFGITTGFSTNNVKVRVSDGRNTVDSPATSLAVNEFVPPPIPGPIVVPPIISNVAQLTAVAAGAGGGPHVQVFNADGSSRFAFFAYDTGFTGGISVATGDVTGDGIEDVITGAGPGGGPHIKVYDGVSGSELRSFFAFSPFFRNGVSIAVGDVNRDGFAEVVVGAGPGGGPHVKVFDGATGGELRSFFAFDSRFRGGVSVAAGDLNNDGRADVVVGAGSGGTPHVKAFDGGSMAVIRDFFPFSIGFGGGVTVAAGDLNRDGKAELLIGQASGGSTVTLIDGETGAGLLSYTLTGANGVRVALSDITGDGVLDPLVASAPGSGSILRVLRVDGSVLTNSSPFGGFGGGVFVG
jgi:FG-GAP-like repeat